jgi:hypothetical protein
LVEPVATFNQLAQINHHWVGPHTILADGIATILDLTTTSLPDLLCYIWILVIEALFGSEFLQALVMFGTSGNVGFQVEYLAKLDEVVSHAGRS